MIRDMLLKQNDKQLYLAAGEITGGTTDKLNIYKFSENGFGDRITDTTTTYYSSDLLNLFFTYTGNELLVCENRNLQGKLYNWSDITGIGSLISNINPNPQASACAISPNFAMFNSYIYTPYLHGFPLTGSGFGTKFSDPIGAESSTDVAINSSENVVCLASNYKLIAYPFSSSGFGTKYSFTQETNAITKIKFSKNDNFIFGLYGIYMNAYSFDYSSGFGTKYTSPSLSSTSSNLDVSPDGNFIAVGIASSPYVKVFPWSDSTHFGTIISNPTTLPDNAVKSVKFSKDGKYLALGLSTSPFINVYEWSPSGFGAKFDSPSTLPSHTILSLDWSFV